MKKAKNSVPRIIYWWLLRLMIRWQLSNFHPGTGVRLRWNIAIHCQRKYDINTGKLIQVGLAKLVITQVQPVALVDLAVYMIENRGFRHFALKKIPNARWS